MTEKKFIFCRFLHNNNKKYKLLPRWHTKADSSNLEETQCNKIWFKIYFFPLESLSTYYVIKKQTNNYFQNYTFTMETIVPFFTTNWYEHFLSKAGIRPRDILIENGHRSELICDENPVAPVRNLQKLNSWTVQWDIVTKEKRWHKGAKIDQIKMFF